MDLQSRQEVLIAYYPNICTVVPGIQLGKENGLTLLLDAEVYDYAFSPQKGEEHTLVSVQNIEYVPMYVLHRMQK